MPRVVMTVIFVLFRLPFWLWKISKYAKDETFEVYDAKTRGKFLHNICLQVLKAARIEVECEGVEKLPKEDGFMIYANHQGMNDILMLLGTTDRFLSFVFKIELANVIVVRRVIKMIRAKGMDRGDVRQSLRVIREVTNEVKNGLNFVIFPEGTRSRNGNELLEFKAGSFKSATNAKCPIVPVAMIDSYKAFESNAIKRVKTKIVYLDPIPYEAYKGMKTNEIAEMVSGRIKACIQANID